MHGEVIVLEFGLPANIKRGLRRAGFRSGEGLHDQCRYSHGDHQCRDERHEVHGGWRGALVLKLGSCARQGIVCGTRKQQIEIPSPGLELGGHPLQRRRHRCATGRK